MRFLGKNGWTEKSLYHFGKKLGRIFKKPRRLSRTEANRRVTDGNFPRRLGKAMRRKMDASVAKFISKHGVPVRPTIKAD